MIDAVGLVQERPTPPEVIALRARLLRPAQRLGFRAGQRAGGLGQAGHLGVHFGEEHLRAGPEPIDRPVLVLEQARVTSPMRDHRNFAWRDVRPFRLAGGAFQQTCAAMVARERQPERALEIMNLRRGDGGVLPRHVHAVNDACGTPHPGAVEVRFSRFPNQPHILPGFQVRRFPEADASVVFEVFALVLVGQRPGQVIYSVGSPADARIAQGRVEERLRHGALLRRDGLGDDGSGRLGGGLGRRGLRGGLGGAQGKGECGQQGVERADVLHNEPSFWYRVAGRDYRKRARFLSTKIGAGIAHRAIRQRQSMRGEPDQATKIFTLPRAGSGDCVWAARPLVPRPRQELTLAPYPCFPPLTASQALLACFHEHDLNHSEPRREGEAKAAVAGGAAPDLDGGGGADDSGAGRRRTGNRSPPPDSRGDARAAGLGPGRLEGPGARTKHR